MDFDQAFDALTGYQPMLWQARLYQRMVTGDVPEACDLPTGLGKTSVIPIWLIALTQCAPKINSRPLPRRLVYVVNRRTVVDQATTVVEQMHDRLQQPQDERWATHEEVLAALKERLRDLSVGGESDEVLGVSTLRGELADNEEWKVDPARPAIVVGTIDMIGSKLLFSGYGDGRYKRPHHAGLIGQDVLIVHDEAHLTPAFSALLNAVVQEQSRETAGSTRRSQAVTRPLRMLELSATTRWGRQTTFGLDKDDFGQPIIQERLGAKKRLFLHPTAEDAVSKRIEELSRNHDAAAAKVLIYVRSPGQAQKVGAALKRSLPDNGEGRVALLTGTMRGYERGRLVKEDPVYRALLDPECRAERTVYLVSTSAGEVGIDLDADHLVCDLTTLDAMIQRLGRVNRRGGAGRSAKVDVVGDAPVKEKDSPLNRALAATYDLLNRWARGQDDGLDVSPGNVRELIGKLSGSECDAVFSPKPEILPATDILFDSWSLTSIPQMPGRPEVAPYLHGRAEWEPPETYVAWRQELRHLANAQVDHDTLSDWFHDCPIEARERLRDHTDRVKAALAKLFKARMGEEYYVVLLDERGDAQWSKLSEVVGKAFNIEYRTVVLPVEVGGLDQNGMLDPNAVDPPDGVMLDVADVDAGQDRRERWTHSVSAEGEQFTPIVSGKAFDGPPHGLREKQRIPLKPLGEGEEDAASLDLVLYVSPRASALKGDPETTGARQTLTAHSDAITARMTAIAEKLGLQQDIQAALVLAARWHDKGKDRPVWQRYACNKTEAEPVAKSLKYLHPWALGGYRHEFGSLQDAMRDEENVAQHPERELILHLIAAHHGWARPHFELRAFDPVHTTAENEAAAVEVLQRFGRLQQRFGRWGLSWLEKLVRCADIAVSKDSAASTDSAPKTREGSR